MKRKPAAALLYTNEPAASPSWGNSGRKITENSEQKTSPRQQESAHDRVLIRRGSSVGSVVRYQFDELQSVFTESRGDGGVSDKTG